MTGAANSCQMVQHGQIPFVLPYTGPPLSSGFLRHCIIVYHRGVVHNWGLRLGGPDKVGQAQPDRPSMRMWIGLKFSCLPNIRDCTVVRIPHYINIYSILHRIEQFNEKTKLRFWPCQSQPMKNPVIYDLLVPQWSEPTPWSRPQMPPGSTTSWPSDY